MANDHTHQLRQALLEERRAQLSRIQSLRDAGLGESQQEAARELSGYDQHTADQGTETFEREKDFGLLAQARVILERIDAALTRMEEGRYGVCEGCGEPIDPARLQALPYATRCVACEEAVEERYHRPVEEEALSPPFGRTFLDGEDQTAYDGEDTWQELARYGTANSPQDVPDAKDFEDAYTDADEAIGVVTELDAVTGGFEPEDPEDDATVWELSIQKRREHDGSGVDGEEEAPREGETV